MTNSNRVNLNLTVHEVNKILNALGQMPYVEVFELIESVKSQAEQQVTRQNGQQDKQEILNHAGKGQDTQKT